MQAAAFSRPRINSNSLHSLFTATTCTAVTCPNWRQARVMSSIGEHLTITLAALASSALSSSTTLGSQSDSATTLRPSPSRRAGSTKIQSSCGNDASNSSLLPFTTRVLPSPSKAKLAVAISHRRSLRSM